MSQSILFGYSVAREEGKIVITIEGEMAGNVMTYLSRRSGRAGVSPFPFGPLGSPSMGLTSLFASDASTIVGRESEEAATTANPTLAEVFGQGFDQTYDEYDARLRGYREILSAQGGDAAKIETGLTEPPQTRERKARADAAS